MNAAPIAIVGATATGKSALAMALADVLGDVTILSADAMQIYQGMDIGTAKVSADIRARVPHLLVDLVAPSVAFGVAAYLEAAHLALAEIHAAGCRPMLVGGTGLYVRAVVDDLTIPGQYPEVRATLDAEPDTAALHRRLAELDPIAADRMTSTNRRRIVRALEVTLGAGRPFSSFGPGLAEYPPSPWRQIGLAASRDDLERRIRERFAEQLADGFLDEVRRLAGAPGGLSATARQALGYRELLRHLEEGAPLDAMVDEAIRRTVQFAKRQERWFRRDPRIAWINAGDDAEALVPLALAAIDAIDRRGSSG